MLTFISSLYVFCNKYINLVTYSENVKTTVEHSERSETYMSSREWLSKYGLRAKKLGFYDVLAGVAFKHRDGVVELKHAPDDEYQTDAVSINTEILFLGIWE